MVASSFVKAPILSFFWLLLLALLTACATSSSQNAGYLLEQDYRQMSNAGLTAYEQDLSDEIARSSASSGSGASIGFGIGTWGGNTGAGLGVDQSLGGGGGGGAPVELRDRREAVRGEMRARGLLPPVGGGK